MLKDQILYYKTSSKQSRVHSDISENLENKLIAREIHRRQQRKNIINDDHRSLAAVSRRFAIVTLSLEVCSEVFRQGSKVVYSPNNLKKTAA